MGLFIKASELLNKQPLAFSSFITKYDIQTFAIFELEDNYYHIIDSYGFDGESIATSSSTKDFWDGICYNLNEVYNFTCYNKTLNPILQFFSLNMKDIINTVSLYRYENYIFMLCNKDITEEMANDLPKINTKFTDIDTYSLDNKFISDSLCYKYEINFTEAIENFIFSLKNKDFVQNELKTSIYNELSNRFACSICKNCTKRITHSSIKVIFSLDQMIESDYIFDLVSLLRPVISDSAELINFNKLGIAHSINDIKKFFQVE